MKVALIIAAVVFLAGAFVSCPAAAATIAFVACTLVAFALILGNCA